MPRSMPGPCRVCGGTTGTAGIAEGGRRGVVWTCARCGWRLGDAPDADLPRPRVEVVYYLRFDRRVKIGTSARPHSRLAAIRHDELLAFEPGGRAREGERHRQFAALREGGEWFTLEEPLTEHIASLQRVSPDPWAAYDRWLGDAYRAVSS